MLLKSGPLARRHRWWRRAYMSQRHRFWRRGLGLGANVAVAWQAPRRRRSLRRAQDLSVKICGAETCKLGATNDDAELRVQILKSYLQEHI